MGKAGTAEPKLFGIVSQTTRLCEKAKPNSFCAAPELPHCISHPEKAAKGWILDYWIIGFWIIGLLDYWIILEEIEPFRCLIHTQTPLLWLQRQQVQVGRTGSARSSEISSHAPGEGSGWSHGRGGQP